MIDLVDGKHVELRGLFYLTIVHNCIEIINAYDPEYNEVTQKLILSRIETMLDKFNEEGYLESFSVYKLQFCVGKSDNDMYNVVRLSFKKCLPHSSGISLCPYSISGYLCVQLLWKDI